jgi:hypothetical protein
MDFSHDPLAILPVNTLIAAIVIVNNASSPFHHIFTPLPQIRHLLLIFMLRYFAQDLTNPISIHVIKVVLTKS